MCDYAVLNEILQKISRLEREVNQQIEGIKQQIKNPVVECKNHNVCTPKDKREELYDKLQ